MPGRTLLDRLESLCNVDVDDASTDFIKSLQPFTPHNQTSNQAIITGELLKPTNEGLLKDLVKQYGSKGWDEVYDRAAVQICARNVPLISGRVLIQTSLRYANDRDAIIRQCRSYAAAFADAGVPRDRFAIKLPFSGAAASAALVLNAEGIRTLATAVFSLEQAIAASQSNCLFISPYYNEIAAHLDPSLRLVFADPALEVRRFLKHLDEGYMLSVEQNPMSARVVHILETYAKAYAATGKEQPIMVIASHFNTAEVLAMAELGCQHVTISAANLVALRETPDSLPPVTRPKPKHPYAELATPERLRVLSTVDPLAGPDWNGVLATMDTDYVADGGAKLDEFLRTDPVAGRRLRDATQFFLQAEDKARQAIEKQIAAAGL